MKSFTALFPFLLFCCFSLFSSDQRKQGALATLSEYDQHNPHGLGARIKIFLEDHHPGYTPVEYDEMIAWSQKHISEICKQTERKIGQDLSVVAPEDFLYKALNEVKADLQLPNLPVFLHTIEEGPVLQESDGSRRFRGVFSRTIPLYAQLNSQKMPHLLSVIVSIVINRQSPFTLQMNKASIWRILDRTKSVLTQCEFPTDESKGIHNNGGKVVFFRDIKWHDSQEHKLQMLQNEQFLNIFNCQVCLTKFVKQALKAGQTACEQVERRSQELENTYCVGHVLNQNQIKTILGQARQNNELQEWMQDFNV